MFYVINDNNEIFMGSEDAGKLQQTLSDNPTFFMVEDVNNVPVNWAVFDSTTSTIVSRDGMIRDTTGQWIPKPDIQKFTEALEETLRRLESITETKRQSEITPRFTLIDVYRQKYEEALAYKNSGYVGDISEYPFIQIEATVRSITHQEMADMIIAAHTSWLDMCAQVEGIRHRAKLDLSVATTIAQLDTIIATAETQLDAI